jgi:hypothetical protein
LTVRVDFPTPPFPDADDVLDLGQRAVRQALRSPELALERLLLPGVEHVEAHVDAGDPLDRLHVLHDGGLEVVTDRAPRRGQRDLDGDLAAFAHVDRADHVQLDDVVVQLGVDDGTERIDDLISRRHGVSVTKGRRGARGRPVVREERVLLSPGLTRRALPARAGTLAPRGRRRGC